MRNGAILVVVATGALVNGLHLDAIPLWRQFLFGLLAVAGYLHGRHLPVRRAWPLLAATAAPVVISMVFDFATGVGAVMSLGVFTVLPWLAGRFRRQQAELVVSGRARLRQMEREQELLAERVRLQERARIASDMHDSLGHELALIALRAGALELAADMNERNREAAADLRASAVTATDRLRRTLAVLRPGSAAPVEPADETVEALVERARNAGLAIAFRHGGATRPLGALVERAVHRVVQESLTNAARHAPGAEVEVEVEQSGDTVTVTVGNPLGAGDPISPDGNGLNGLRERVRLLGGTFEAGADRGDFTVTARLPRGEL
ncbi:sensor histidine kinase [Rhizohabitans arisaemae]|uniref:sensor histidine kinase n=1 Tax=Rhizohabitans arisaemae TaxID=2720610 RepID=UPI0024B14E87|nr:histidine kinase [Rhizohabitans arisaemae]